MKSHEIVQHFSSMHNFGHISRSGLSINSTHCRQLDCRVWCCRHMKRFTQASVNKRRKLAENAAPRNLKLHDFVMKKRERAQTAPVVNLKVAKAVSTFHSVTQRL